MALPLSSGLPSSLKGAEGGLSLCLRSERLLLRLCRFSGTHHRCASAKKGRSFRHGKGASFSSSVTSSSSSSQQSQGPSFTPFHLAIPVHDVQAARDFYGKVLGCPEGRSSKTWVDFNLYGHQLVCHHVPSYSSEVSANLVDGDPVPIPHFGLAMAVPDFLNLAQKVRSGGIQFIIEPHIRFEGQPGEQWTMFFKDKSGNSLEFKAMTNPNNLFAKYNVKDGN